MAVTEVGHVGIVVEDLDRMYEFYTRVIGLQETGHSELEGPVIEALLGLDGLRLEVRLLGTPDRPRAVELLKYHTHPSTATSRTVNQHGLNHVQFQVDDLDRIMQVLEDQGIEPWGATPEFNERRVLYARDPEGNSVELSEAPPADASG